MIDLNKDCITEEEVTIELAKRVAYIAKCLGRSGHPCNPYTGDQIAFPKELHPIIDADQNSLLRYRSREFNNLKEANSKVNELDGSELIIPTPNTEKTE